MKRFYRLFLLSALVIFQGVAHSGIVHNKLAGQVAKNHYWLQFSKTTGLSLDQVSAELVLVKTMAETPLFYIFNINITEGFVIVSADNRIRPVLGFSNEQSYLADDTNFPPAFIEMLALYTKQIYQVDSLPPDPSPGIQQMWDDLLGSPYQLDGGRSISPLIGTNWNQSCYYNELCPYDAGAPYGYCSHVPVGCVAVAMGQVMKYWDFPVVGTGTHSYYASPYGTQTANFGNTTYDWESMPSELNANNTAVATLLYHCGVAVNMQYGPNGSGAYTGETASALETYFNYDEGIAYVNKSSYSNEVWENMLRGELDLERPVIYRGQGSGGHAWVCDGYSGTNYFHMNWGWGGYYNGYFYLSDLTPGSYSFTSNQAVVLGIVPSDMNTYPPVDLHATVLGNDVQLSWGPPNGPPDDWLHWDEGNNFGGLGLQGGGSFLVAAKWEPSHLEQYDDQYITKVQFFPLDDQPTFKIHVWKGPNASTALHSQTISNINVGQWNVVELSNSIPVDVTVDLWIGMEISGQLPGVNPVGYDAGPAVIGYGDMLSFDGVTWETATTYGLDFNWNLQTYIAPEPDQSKTDQTSINDFTATANSSFQLVYEQTKKTAYPPDAGSRDLLGYNIYRDDIKVNTSIHPGLIYLDGNVPLGQHTYFVTAVYNQGESIPSDAVMINIGMAEQVITLSEGWNGVSSYLLPESPDFESICLSITGNLEFAQNLSGYYYPEFDINTLGDWNEKSGYLFKVNAGCELPIAGFTFDDRTVQLYSGWNLIPVLSECEVVTTDLFYGIVGNITVVKDAAGSGIYWPSMNINTIPVMLPGRSYWVKIFSNKTITFPECEN